MCGVCVSMQQKISLALFNKTLKDKMGKIRIAVPIIPGTVSVTV
jgi:hypothetical protein